jgi:putative Ca2+/H+ antiporter (TMEM165/GDT1 family)
MDLLHSVDIGFHAPLFASTVVVIFLAEIPDKTSLAMILLATGRRPWAVFAGAAAAFVVQTLVAVLAGSTISLLPHLLVQVVSGALFLGFAILLWLRADDVSTTEEVAIPTTFWSVAGKSFMVIFIAEWGDLTQLATAALVAKYPYPVTIAAAAILALWTVTALAIIVGSRLRQIIRPRLLQRVASVVFALIAVLIWCGVGLS